MIKEARVLAIGSAYVEGKIQSAELKLPSERDQLSGFLDSHTEAALYAGGSVPNILTSFASFSGNPNIRLLSCVGSDRRGSFYKNNMLQGLGEPQVTRESPTDIWVGIYNQGLVEGLDLYGAVANLSVSREELNGQKNGVFVTDVDVCKLPKVPDQIAKTVDHLEDDGLFALSLVGSSPRENIQKVLSFTQRAPDLVFGNARELQFISGEIDFNTGLKTVFSSSRLVVITRAEQGASIRLNGEVFDVPVKVIPQERVVDETGAGDTFMGIMMASLLRTDLKDWQESHALRAADLAAFGASLVIQSMHSRLTDNMAKQVSNFERRIYDT